MKKYSKLNKITLFDVVNTSLVVILTIVIIYPLYFSIIASFSDPTAVVQGKTLLWIEGFTLEMYQNIIADTRIWVGYRNTLIYTLLGTIYNLMLTIPAAYVMTKKWLPFQNVLSWYFFITMYIGGGMIPTYFLIRDLNLLDNPLVLIIGSGVSCYNLIVTRQYFSTSIPADIYDAAYIDGAAESRCFARIAMPLAKPIIAVMALYYGVGHWNSYYTALLYIRNEDYFPLQLVLRNILLSNEAASGSIADIPDMELVEYLMRKAYMAQGMKYGIIIIASLPVLIAYPFLQKYFAKGVMIGSVKG